MKYIVINKDKIALFEWESQFELFKIHGIDTHQISSYEEYKICFTDDDFSGQTLTEMNLSLDLNQAISDVIQEKSDMIDLANLIMSGQYTGQVEHKLVVEQYYDPGDCTFTGTFMFDTLPNLEIKRVNKAKYVKNTKMVINPNLSSIRGLMKYFYTTNYDYECVDLNGATKFHQNSIMRFFYPKLKTNELLVQKDSFQQIYEGSILSEITFGKLSSLLTPNERREFESRLAKYNGIKTNKEKETDRQNIQQKLNNVKK